MTFVRFGVYALCVLLSLESRMVGGCVHGDSTVCTDDKINKCITDNDQAPHGCFLNKPIIKCIGEFVDSCKGQMQISAKEQMDYHQFRLDSCPPLPDGECWNKPLSNCTDQLPSFAQLPLGLNGKVPSEPDKPNCQLLMRLQKPVMNCMQKFIDWCNAKDTTYKIKDRYWVELQGKVDWCKEQFDL